MNNDFAVTASQCVQEYLEHLLSLRRRMHGQDASTRDSIWTELYSEWTRDGMSPHALPRLLSLIHPDFYSKNGTSFEDYENLSYKNTHRFRSGITDIDACQAGKYLGTDCIFNEHRHLRGKCEADHIWPHSLGGPSVIENRLLLCKFHNGMKSYNVYHFDWSTIPMWLPGYLKKIFLLKG